MVIKVLAFDTFGTVTDWHTGVSDRLAEIFPVLDAAHVACDWRRTYSPALADVETAAPTIATRVQGPAFPAWWDR
ncbi:hypothetical protein [Rhodococcus sp. OK302]|uniref:hypothetical protein n=1 Tax=Rhodococcus sp. OK302 TaxID=1882769 RepID=UPI000B9F532D|nr:hypothetical protein BDB13_6291 [Rhodococcus sp. OK302]